MDRRRWTSESGCDASRRAHPFPDYDGGAAASNVRGRKTRRRFLLEGADAADTEITDPEDLIRAGDPRNGGRPTKTEFMYQT